MAGFVSASPIVSVPASRRLLECYPDETQSLGPGGAFLAGGSQVTEESVAVVFADHGAAAAARADLDHRSRPVRILARRRGLRTAALGRLHRDDGQGRALELGVSYRVSEYAQASGSIPRRRSLFGLHYGWQGITFRSRWQHVDAMRDARYPDCRAPLHDYVDAGATWEFDDGRLEGLTATIGVENLLDEAPPIFPSYSQSNTEPALYDVLGQRYFVSLRYQF